MLFSLINIHLLKDSTVKEKIYFLREDGTFAVRSDRGTIRYIPVITMALTYKLSQADLWRSKLRELKDLLPKK